MFSITLLLHHHCRSSVLVHRRWSGGGPATGSIHWSGIGNPWFAAEIKTPRLKKANSILSSSTIHASALDTLPSPHSGPLSLDARGLAVHSILDPQSSTPSLSPSPLLIQSDAATSPSLDGLMKVVIESGNWDFS